MATAPARAIEQSEAGSVRSADAYADTAAAPALRKPSAAVRSFLTDSQCVAVTLSDHRPRRRLDDPFRPMSGRLARVWWVHNRRVGAGDQGSMPGGTSSDIAGIARQLRRRSLVPNRTAIANAEAAICRMDALLAAAKQHGLLTMLNTRYRIEQTSAPAGKSFPPYGTVHRRSAAPCCASLSARCLRAGRDRIGHRAHMKERRPDAAH